MPDKDTCCQALADALVWLRERTTYAFVPHTASPVCFFCNDPHPWQVCPREPDLNTEDLADDV